MCVWINLIKSTFKGKLFSATLLQVPKSLTKKRRMIFFSVVGTHRDRTKKFLKADCDFSRHVSQKTYDVTKRQVTSHTNNLKEAKAQKEEKQQDIVFYLSRIFLVFWKNWQKHLKSYKFLFLYKCVNSIFNFDEERNKMRPSQRRAENFSQKFAFLSLLLFLWGKKQTVRLHHPMGCTRLV